MKVVFFNWVVAWNGERSQAGFVHLEQAKAFVDMLEQRNPDYTPIKIWDNCKLEWYSA